MKVADVGDTDSIKRLGPVGCDDLLFSDNDFFAVVAAIDPAPGESVGTRRDQEVANPGLPELHGGARRRVAALLAIW